MFDLDLLLARTNMGRESRQYAADAVLSSEDSLALLCKQAFNPEATWHRIACAILDLACERNIAILQPYLPKFIKSLPLLTDQSAIRVMARICIMLSAQNILDEKQRTQIATCCFDWLIGPYKVAAQANAIYTLIHLNRYEKWIAGDLLPIIEKDYSAAPVSYKAAARRALKKLKIK